ncbi:HAD-IIIA family hydrolase [Bacillus weihaiensis]|uniref:D,D-heptose 1,7-bisphosphate phosphatase n=1 Tax=Bacillus weihaiensis TaxID=1547283 RepID=A0A1L3MUQ3_9BACI|nr:HAD-IIIA family hydrolase [Bacillus weihaiensis]APH06062.1 hypothetical protein A9C19_15665 [Bacillus weihaiensis]
MSKHIQAVFLDRDGTIGGSDSIHYPGDFHLFTHAQELIWKLKNDRIKILSFTNQPDISEGKATIQDFIDELITFGFDDIYICPHDQSEGCPCRKPEIGMLIEGAEKHQLHLEKCVVIGDRWSDMVAASKANCIKILVKTGAGISTLNEHYDKLEEINIEYVAENLEEAINWLYSHYDM